MPRYEQSWDVNVALEHLRSLPSNQDLPLSTLVTKVLKLSLLLALTAPKRSSELKLLHLRFMRIVFELPGLTKTSSDITLVFFAKFDVICKQRV
jgi:hypothetical protein